MSRCTARYMFVLLALCLSACSSSPQNKNQATHIGWHCDGEPGTASWHCSQRPMRNGRVVGEVAASAIIANSVAVNAVNGNKDKAVEEGNGARESSVQILKNTASPALSGDHQPLSWREQLPGLDGSSVANTKVVEDVPLKSGAVIETRPEVAPQPEPAFEEWESRSQLESGNSGTAGEILLPEQVAATPIEERTSQQAEHLNKPPDSVTGNYTVQLAAFNQKAEAQQFIKSERWRGVELEIAPRIRDGRRFFVVTYGQFASRGEAIAGWNALNLGGEQNVWVRAIK